MELYDIVTLAALPVSFLIGLNVRTYKETKEWLDTHRIDPSWNEKFYKRFREMSPRGYLMYYLGMLGSWNARQTNYILYSD